MKVTEGVIFISLSDLHSQKAESSIEVTVEGIIIVDNDVHLQNEFFPMEDTE